ncbi:MAG: 1-phosphofructokinase [Candidatus Omnitrophica bacterium]|nr:1-phosphofructokinase [Candidatus Omnitrophota bacterium]
MIGTITLNPSVDQHMAVRKFLKDDAMRAVSVERFAGGKGINVSRVVHELGGETCAFGFIGGSSGQMLARWLDEAGIAHLFVEIGGETRINMTVTDLSDRTQSHIRMKGPSVSREELDRLTRQVAAAAPGAARWALGGSLPPGVPDDFYRRLIQMLEDSGAQCVLDTDDEALTAGLDATPFMIKPNEYEFERLTGEPADTDDRIVRAAGKLVRKGIQVVMTTLGPRGAVVVTEGEAFRINTPPVEVKSKVGAGDSTIAGFLVGLERGLSLREAARYGIAAGTAAVLTEGTTLCERKEVERIFPQIQAVSL